VRELVRAGRRVGWLTFNSLGSDEEPRVVRMLMPAEPSLYAAQLYAVLHVLDESGVERIVVALPPDQPEWLAVRDRLRRAAV
jgi:L-threonylcarbamoyladenylate synthase